MSDGQILSLHCITLRMTTILIRREGVGLQLRRKSTPSPNHQLFVILKRSEESFRSSPETVMKYYIELVLLIVIRN